MSKVNLGDVFESQITGEWGKECEDSDGVKVIRTTNFTTIGVIDYENVVVRDIEEKKVNAKRLLPGDIILEKSGGTDKTPVGRVIYCDRKIEEDVFLCNNFTQAMRTNPNVAISKYIFYLMWYFHFIGKTDLMQNKTTGIRNLQVKSYLSQVIDLPSLPEQQEIADTLDKVSDLIEKRKQQLEKLDLLVKSRFAEMFGDPVTNDKNWMVLNIKDTCLKVLGGGTPSKSHEEYFTGDIPWVSPKDMKCLRLYDSKDHITEEAVEKSTTKMIKENSVLMVIRSGVLKHSLPIAINMVPVTINQDMKAFVPNYDLINTEYLLYYFNAITPDVLTKVRAVTADNIEFKDFLKRLVPVPPLDLQNQFADFVTATEQQKEKIKKSLETLETLKASLMQKYFG